MNIKVKTALRAILIGATVLPLIIVAVAATVNIFSFSKTMIAEETQTSGIAQSAGVINIASGLLNDADALSKMAAVKDFATDPINKTNIANMQGIADAFKNGRNVLDVVVTKNDGTVVYSAKESSKNKHFFAYGDDGYKSEKYISGFYTEGTVYETPVFAAVAKISDDKTDGYIAVVVDTKEITDYLASCTFLTHGRLVITDGSTVLNYNDAVVSAAGELDSAISPNSVSEIVASNSSEASVALEDSSYVGQYGSITGTGWAWLSLYPASETTSGVFMVFIISMVILVALILICVLVMVIATQKVIDPMLGMLSTMREINSGNHSERINVNGMSKEFAGMASVFNEMMDESLMSEELHKTVSDLSDNMLFEWDFSKEAMFVSDNFKAKIDLPISGATLSNGKFIDSLMEEEEAEKYKRDMTSLFKTKSDVGGEYKMKTPAGQEMWVSMRAHCITDRLGEVLRVIGVLTDITSEKNATLKLAERASFDFLSQLYNRNTFEREFASELERNVGKKVAALFIDVDDFKFINDRYSHAVGDEVIRFVADVIKSKTGETGFAGRFGGDEFVLCISDPKLVENVEVLSMDIIDDLYAGYYSKSVDTTLNIKASIGIAIFPDHSTDGKQLVGCADAAMYFVKKNGKANYHIYEPEDSNLEGNFMSSL